MTAVYVLTVWIGVALAGVDVKPAAPAPLAPAPPATALGLATPLDPKQVAGSLQTVGLFALVSLAPVAVLMVTAFVRINIVLTLLRQALGSPQVPGNQVLMALALLLTALVMWPVGNQVYSRGIEPYATGRLSAAAAWERATKPIKAFMVQQIESTRHQDYLWQLYDYGVPPTPGRADPVYGEDFPLRVVAPAFLLSELTTALTIGFYLYLPFLVIDLVVSAVLAAMGLFMLPPSLVALPLKLILFVLADGWLLVASMLLQSFGTT
jgi:flagellar biosynthetic protein FliP